MEAVGSVEAKVVHIKKDAYDVYVGRGKNSKWGNPFEIGEPHPETGKPITRAESINLFKEWILRGAGRCLLKYLGELEQKTLGCFCAPTGGVTTHDPIVCHGQIYLLLLEHRREKIEQKKVEQKKEKLEVPQQTQKKPASFRTNCGAPKYVFFGSRTWDETVPIREALYTLPENAVVITGGARGADKTAENVARRMGFEVQVFPAQWEKFGKSAGYRRNELMANWPGVVKAFGFRMPGKSNGTDHMQKTCEKLGIETTVQVPAKSYHLPV